MISYRPPQSKFLSRVENSSSKSQHRESFLCSSTHSFSLPSHLVACLGPSPTFLIYFQPIKTKVVWFCANGSLVFKKPHKDLQAKPRASFLPLQQMATKSGLQVETFLKLLVEKVDRMLGWYLQATNSLATRFIPSLSGVIRATSASR